MGKNRFYFYKKDNEKNALDEYDKKVDESKDKNKDKWIYHYEVLPHAFFGDISKAKVIFLAKNPSYVEYDDEYDDWLYLEKFSNEHPDVEFDLNTNSNDYEKDLKNVNFFESYKTNYNRCFYTTWKWWKSNVIDKVKCGGTKALKSSEVAFVNISGYQSEQYKAHDYTKDINKDNWFGSSLNKKTLLDRIKNEDVITIIVWGKNEWSQFLSESKNGDFFKNNKSGKFIVLNDTCDRDKKGEKIGRQHINSIYSILKNEQDYKEKNIYNDNEISVLKDWFSIDESE